MAPMGFGFQRRGGRRRFAIRVGRIARRATGIVLAKRILLDKLTIPDITSADYDNPLTFNLVAATEAQEEDVESTGGTTAGTDVATIPLYSKLLSLKLALMVHAMSAQTVFRWSLYKSPDGDLTLNQTTNFHTSNDSITDRENRKFTLAKGMFVSNASSTVNRIPIFIRRKAWQRASPMREGDLLKFSIAKDAAGTTAQLSGFGTLYVRANG